MDQNSYNHINLTAWKFQHKRIEYRSFGAWTCCRDATGSVNTILTQWVVKVFLYPFRAWSSCNITRMFQDMNSSQTWLKYSSFSAKFLPILCIDMLFPGDNLFKSGSSMNDIETRLNKLYTPEPQPCPGWRRSVADCTAHVPGGLGIAGLYGRSFPPIYWMVVKDDEWNAGVWTTIYRYTCRSICK